VAELRRRLLAWYRAARRDLPWRRTRDAYAVWISEAMLQQTRVETVLPYWERFLARFPSVEALAAAGEDEVLALWSGLGYYSRARKLREAARQLVERHGGRFPRERAAAEALAGVGPYTAGAVLSIAYDLAEPLVDGNVARVFCRWFALEGDPAAGAVRRALWERAAELVPVGGGAGDWNQALMELGATVCLPRAPRCGECPVAEPCAARAEGRQEELPQLRPRRAPVEVALEVALCRRGGRWLLERRPEGGRMAGLLQFPTRERVPPGGEARGLFPADWPAALCTSDPVGELRHSITHHRIRAEVRAGRAGFRGALPGLSWHAEEELAALQLTGMARKILRAGMLERAAGR
jgi:A/G-specific adenine glycosylase